MKLERSRDSERSSSIKAKSEMMGINQSNSRRNFHSKEKGVVESRMMQIESDADKKANIKKKTDII